MDFDCKKRNKELAKARQRSLFELADAIINGTYTPGVQDDVLLRELKRMEHKNSEQYFNVKQSGDQFTVSFYGGGFVGELFTNEQDAELMRKMCVSAFEAGERTKINELRRVIGEETYRD